MILDGYWKKELSFQSRLLCIIQRPLFLLPLQEHIANKAVLLSAVAARKAFEDELWAERKAKEMTAIHFESDLLKLKISATVRNCIDSFEHPPGHVVIESYGRPKVTSVDPRIIINNIIHAYYWDWTYNGQNRFDGFLVASDHKKQECLYAVKLDEWISFLISVNNLSHID